jgi:hypothetical protein
VGKALSLSDTPIRVEWRALAGIPHAKGLVGCFELWFLRSNCIEFFP